MNQFDTNNIPAQDQESTATATATEQASDNSIGNEINDTAKIAEEEKIGTAVSENTNEEASAPAEASETEPADVTEARTRALAQIERISHENGFSGAWGNLFREYPTLTRADAVEELRDAVRGGLSPLEAYQQKLLAEKDKELETLRNSSTVTGRSAGEVSESDADQQLDDFLIGFYSV